MTTPDPRVPVDGPNLAKAIFALYDAQRRELERLIVGATLARVLLRQGHTGRALAVLEQLLMGETKAPA